MSTHVEWVVARRDGDKSPLAHGSLGNDPHPGSSELCDPLDPRPLTVLDPPPGGTAPTAVGRLEPAGLRAALVRLGALSGTARGSARWWNWITRLDAKGRVTLPGLARSVVDTGGALRVSSRGQAVLLRRQGPGAALVLDGRGRVPVPGWLRHDVGAGGAVHVAARRPDASVVLVAPVASLDVVADGVAGEVG